MLLTSKCKISIISIVAYIITFFTKVCLSLVIRNAVGDDDFLSEVFKLLVVRGGLLPTQAAGADLVAGCGLNVGLHQTHVGVILCILCPSEW